jgi:hypothetical protein
VGGFLDLDAIVLARGAHARRVDGVSVLEAVAWWAGEPHSDQPACVSPVLATFVRGWADALDDQPRQQLKAWVPKLATTGGDGSDPQRALLLADWLARTYAPAFLEAAGLEREAGVLKRAAELDGWGAAVGILPDLEQAARAAHRAMDGAWAVRISATDAPRVAMTATGMAGAVAAGEALRHAVGHPPEPGLVAALARALRLALDGGASAADAALSRVRVLALNVIQGQAGDVIDAAAQTTALRAPPDAAWLALRPVVQDLQAGAVDLLDRLCTAGKVTVS